MTNGGTKHAVSVVFFLLSYCFSSVVINSYGDIHKGHQHLNKELGSVAGPVIQASGRLTFEDDLRSGGLLCFTTQ